MPSETKQLQPTRSWCLSAEATSERKLEPSPKGRRAKIQKSFNVFLLHSFISISIQDFVITYKVQNKNPRLQLSKRGANLKTRTYCLEFTVKNSSPYFFLIFWLRLVQHDQHDLHRLKRVSKPVFHVLMLSQLPKG